MEKQRIVRSPAFRRCCGPACFRLKAGLRTENSSRRRAEDRESCFADWREHLAVNETACRTISLPEPIVLFREPIASTLRGSVVVFPFHGVTTVAATPKPTTATLDIRTNHQSQGKKEPHPDSKLLTRWTHHRDESRKRTPGPNRSQSGKAQRTIYTSVRTHRSQFVSQQEYGNA